MMTGSGFSCGERTWMKWMSSPVDLGDEVRQGARASPHPRLFSVSPQATLLRMFAASRWSVVWVSAAETGIECRRRPVGHCGVHHRPTRITAPTSMDEVSARGKGSPGTVVFYRLLC
jgi:hypothetical protein